MSQILIYWDKKIRFQHCSNALQQNWVPLAVCVIDLQTQFVCLNWLPKVKKPEYKKPWNPLLSNITTSLLDPNLFCIPVLFLAGSIEMVLRITNLAEGSHLYWQEFMLLRVRGQEHPDVHLRICLLPIISHFRLGAQFVIMLGQTLVVSWI